MSGRIFLRGPRFTMVPDEVIRLPLGDKAFRLYTVLLSFADKDGSAFPSNRTLCEVMCVASVETLRRAKLELVEAGLLAVRPGARDNGSQTSNDYELSRVPGELLAGEQGVLLVREQEEVLAGEHPGRRVSSELESVRTPPKGPPVPVKANGQVVSTQEMTTAQLVLDAFNDRTGSNPPFRSMDWLRKIVLRLREHPELGWEDFDGVIARALANPWWEGNPSPSVIFGNGALFEQVMVTTVSQPRRKRRYGTGVTAGEIGELAQRLREAGR